MAISAETKDKFRKIVAEDYGMDLKSSEAAVLLNDIVQHYRLLYELSLKAEDKKKTSTLTRGDK